PRRQGIQGELREGPARAFVAAVTPVAASVQREGCADLRGLHVCVFRCVPAAVTSDAPLTLPAVSMQPTTSLVEELGRAVRNVPDFPRPGIQFKDITPILADPHLLRGAVAALAEPFRGERITKIVGVESRGFILGGLLADAFDAGFVPVRKKGKLPYETVSAEYALEYGTDRVEMHVDALQP